MGFFLIAKGSMNRNINIKIKCFSVQVCLNFHRLKKEMVQRVNQVAAEFRKVSNKQMAETTKRTIRENVSINAQLAKMSDKTMELIQVRGQGSCEITDKGQG